MALLKAHPAAKLAILVNCCTGLIYGRPAVQRHWLVFKEKSQAAVGLVCTRDGRQHVRVAPPSRPSPAALASPHPFGPWECTEMNAHKPR